MPDTTKVTPAPTVAVRYRGRLEQIGIYFGKFLRMLVYQNDWKVLPMAALIAGLVAMVMSSSLFLSMEGTLMGDFALVMVCIWNGCFNSIQVICRERDVIKREHRSGMHISSYIVAHMMYQGILCLMQTVITLYVTKALGIRYDLCEPLFSRWILLDLGVSMFLITYAADMMSLWISSLVRSTTTAMTIMPFLLIVQLVFSGGMFTLPSWTAPLTNLAVSSYGVNVLAAQSDYNHRPLVALWNRVQAMGGMELSGSATLGQILDFMEQDPQLSAELRSTEISTTFTVGQVVDFLRDTSDPQAQKLRAIDLGGVITREEAVQMLTEAGTDMARQYTLREVDAQRIGAAFAQSVEESGALDDLPKGSENGTVTLGEAIDSADEMGMLDDCRDQVIEIKTTLGMLFDYLEKDPAAESLRERSFTYTTNVAQLQSMIGVERVRTVLQETAAQGNIKESYEHSRSNVAYYWVNLVLFTLAFAALSVITLEFIDKDKR